MWPDHMHYKLRNETLFFYTKQRAFILSLKQFYYLPKCHTPTHHWDHGPSLWWALIGGMGICKQLFVLDGMKFLVAVFFLMVPSAQSEGHRSYITVHIGLLSAHHVCYSKYYYSVKWRKVDLQMEWKPGNYCTIKYRGILSGRQMFGQYFNYYCNCNIRAQSRSNN